MLLLFLVLAASLTNSLTLNFFNRVSHRPFQLQSTSLSSDREIKGQSVRPWEKEAWFNGWTTCKNETASVLEGSVPTDIEGTYFRNGHAKFEVNKDLVMHPFDADGMVTAISMKDGKATFRNRFVRTKGYVREKKERKILYRGAFGTGKSGGFLSNIFDVKIKNVANTNVIYWGDKLLALWEGGLPHRMEADSLRTLGEYRFKGLLDKKKGDTFSAHPRVDSTSGNLVNFGTNQGVRSAEISVYEFDKDYKVVKTRKFEVPGFVFFHDFIVTENYYIFNKAPIKFDPIPFLLGFVGPAECIEFDKTSPAQLYLIPRDGVSPVKTINVDSHFNFHFANAYEDSNKQITFDVVWCDNMQLGRNEEKKLQVWKFIDYARDVPYSTLVRYVLTPPSGGGSDWTFEKKSLSPTQLDFPTVNPKVSCAKHRYVYAASGSDNSKSTPVQGVIKLDTETGNQWQWLPEPYEFLGESVFVGKEGSTSEDDGYLMTFLFNGHSSISEFVIFDAKDIEKGPISRQACPTKVPFGLHGSFANKLTFDPETAIRKHKACVTLDNKNWGSLGSGFSGLGIAYEFDNNTML